MSDVLSWLLGAWFAAVAFLVAYRFLTGQISLRGLLSRAAGTTDSGGSGKFSPERAQLLVVTVGALAAYVSTALSEGRMPEVDGGVLTLFAVSHGVYLGGKITRR
jgi:hypothetical protein